MVPTEDELKEKEDSELRPMFLKSLSAYWDAPDILWEYIDFGEAEPTTITDAFNILVNQGDIESDRFTNVYDFIITNEGYGEKITFTCKNGEEDQLIVNQKLKTMEFLIKESGKYKITATQNNKYAEKEIEIVVPESEKIQFTIDGTTYEAPAGVTWAEWVDLSYNTGGFYSQSYAFEIPETNQGFDTGKRVHAQNGKVILLNGKAVRSASVIIKNGEYISNPGSDYDESLYTE